MIPYICNDLFINLFQKNNYYCFIHYAKAFGCVDHNKPENSSRDWNTRPPTCLLRNLYTSQEATVRTRHGKTDWFQIGKGVQREWKIHCLHNIRTGCHCQRCGRGVVLWWSCCRGPAKLFIE